MEQLVKYENKIRSYHGSENIRIGIERELRGVCVDNGFGEVNNLIYTRRADYIIKHFSDLTLAQIAEAFQMNTTGKWKEVNPFNSFDNKYVGGVLRQYLEYLRKKKTKKIANIQAEVIQVLSQEELENYQKESFNFIKAYIKKEHKVPEYAPFEAAYKYAEREGIISPTDDEKEMFKENVKAEIQEEVDRDKNSDSKTIRDIAKGMSLNLNLKYECRKRYMKKYFENLLIEKI